MREFTGCTRSHPHEEMSPECVYKTEVARTVNKLANELEAANQRELELLAVIDKKHAALQAMVDSCSEHHCGLKIADDALVIEPSQALREHEAKIVAGREKERIQFHQLLSAETTAKIDYKQRAEAAEEKLRELEMQEPVAWIRRHKLDLSTDSYPHIDYFKSDAEHWLSQYKPGFAWLQPLYAKPFSVS